MYDFIKIKAGTLKPRNRSFIFKMHEDLVLSAGPERTLLVISGDNGSGKTTFLEQFIIPQLKRKQAVYNFFSQDEYLQKITSRCVETIHNLSTRSLLRQILTNSEVPEPESRPLPATTILLMDETDKNTDPEEFIQQLINKDYKLVILISHNFELLPAKQIYASFGNCKNLFITASARHRSLELMPCPVC